jgi:hypothetical protein
MGVGEAIVFNDARGVQSSWEEGSRGNQNGRFISDLGFGISMAE